MGKLLAITLVAVFAIVGFFDWIAGPLMLKGFRALLYSTETTRTLPAPGGRLVAVEEVTRGGLGTVWTTRVLLRDQSGGGQRAYVYQNQDSDFDPPMRWRGPEQLMLCIPEGRVDYMANPRDYAAAQDAIGRVSVRFVYCPAGAKH